MSGSHAYPPLNWGPPSPRVPRRRLEEARRVNLRSDRSNSSFCEVVSFLISDKGSLTRCWYGCLRPRGGSDLRCVRSLVRILTIRNTRLCIAGKFLHYSWLLSEHFQMGSRVDFVEHYYLRAEQMRNRCKTELKILVPHAL
jgi:hypothetical protein